MIRARSFDLSNFEGRDLEANFEVAERGSAYELHIAIEKEGLDEKHERGTVGHIDTEDLEQMTELIDRYLASKSESKVTHSFDKIMYMDEESLYDDPKWVKKGQFTAGLGYVGNQHMLQLSMNPYDHKQGFNIIARLGDDKNLLSELNQFLRDSIKTPLNIEKPKDVPEPLINAEKRLDMAIEKFYIGSMKESVSEAREAFDVIKNKQSWLKDNLPEKKIEDLIASRKRLVSNGLHEVDRGEKLTSEDAELIIRDIINMVNYIDESL